MHNPSQCRALSSWRKVGKRLQAIADPYASERRVGCRKPAGTHPQRGIARAGSPTGISLSGGLEVATAIDHGARTSAGVLAKLTPEVRAARARKAAAVSNGPAGTVTRFLRALPELTDEQLSRVRRALDGR